MKLVLPVICAIALTGCDFEGVGHQGLHEQLRDEVFFPRSLVVDKFDEIHLDDDETILRNLDEPPLYNLRFNDDAKVIRLLWKPSLHPPVVMRAWRANNENRIRVTRPEGFIRQADGTPSFNSLVSQGHEDFQGIDSTYSIPDETWNDLVALSEFPDIWEPLSKIQRAYGESLRDGDTWVVEKVFDGDYLHNRFPNPRFDPVAVGDSRSYKSTVKLGEFLVSLLPGDPPKWERYGGETGDTGNVPSVSGPFDPFTENGANKPE